MVMHPVLPRCGNNQFSGELCVRKPLVLGEVVGIIAGQSVGESSTWASGNHSTTSEISFWSNESRNTCGRTKKLIKITLVLNSF